MVRTPTVQRSLAMSASLLLMIGLFSSCALTPIRGGPVPPDRLVDGVYSGRARNGPVVAAVEVTVEDQQISHIEITRHGHWRGGRAEEPIPEAIIEQQSTRVDVVSGATISSTALMNAVQDAVEKAMN